MPSKKPPKPRKPKKLPKPAKPPKPVKGFKDGHPEDDDFQISPADIDMLDLDPDDELR